MPITAQPSEVRTQQSSRYFPPQLFCTHHLLPQRPTEAWKRWGPSIWSRSSKPTFVSRWVFLCEDANIIVQLQTHFLQKCKRIWMIYKQVFSLLSFLTFEVTSVESSLRGSGNTCLGAGCNLRGVGSYAAACPTQETTKCFKRLCSKLNSSCCLWVVFLGASPDWNDADPHDPGFF